MMRKSGTIALTLMAMATLAAVAAPGAWAADHKFKISETPPTLTGTQEEAHRFAFTGHNDGVECEKAHLEGSQDVEEVEAVRLRAAYTGSCETDAGLEASISTDGCDFVFSGDTTESEHAPVTIDCAHEGAITINITGLCAVEISDTHPEEQEVNQALHGVHYTNITDAGSGKEAVTMEFTVQGIAYRAMGAFCAFAGFEDGATTQDAAYVGKSILKDKGGGRDVTIVE